MQETLLSPQMEQYISFFFWNQYEVTMVQKQIFYSNVGTVSWRLYSHRAKKVTNQHGFQHIAVIPGRQVTTRSRKFCYMVQMPSDGGYEGPFINSERSTQLSQGCCFILKEGQWRPRKPKIIVVRPWICNIQVPTTTEVLESSTQTFYLSENFSSTFIMRRYWLMPVI